MFISTKRTTGIANEDSLLFLTILREFLQGNGQGIWDWNIRIGTGKGILAWRLGGLDKLLSFGIGDEWNLEVNLSESYQRMEKFPLLLVRCFS